MTNWRDLLDEYEARTVQVGAETGTQVDVDAMDEARRAIELALNRAGVMCWGCGKRSAGKTSTMPHRCVDCGKPYDAPEGT